VDRFGSFNNEQRKFATSTLGNDDQVVVQKDEALIDLKDSSDGGEVENTDPPLKKQCTTEDDVPWNDFPLLPDEDVDEQDENSNDLNSDISDSTADESVSNTQSDHDKLHTFMGAELVQLEQGSDAHLFFECVAALPQGVYVETPPPIHTEGVFQQIFTCPVECLLPMLTHINCTRTTVV
jgi:hypothetical protein